MAALWVGSLWTIGYVVAPTLFATLADRALAGTIAGNVFRVEAWVSLACAFILVMIQLRQPSGMRAGRFSSLQLILAMAACTLIGYFGLQPLMSAMREAAAASGGVAADARRNFGILHGAASGIFVVQSLLGVALIFKLR